ncbi:hypothetical protein BsWGS_25535 [Bradybaena similaris]
MTNYLETLFSIDDLLNHLPENPMKECFASAWIYMTTNYTKFQIVIWGSFILHECVYFAASTPGIIFQFLPCMKQFKLQPSRPETFAEQWTCFRRLMFNHTCLLIPLIVGIYIFIEFFQIPYGWKEMPPWYNLTLRVFACAVIEDTWSYFAHRALHDKRIYRHIHKVHHHFQAPFGLTAQYTHPADTIIQGVGLYSAVLLLSNHMVLVWAVLIVRLLESIYIHSGYDIPYLNVFHLIPFYGGPRFHDFHHLNFTGNYAPIFTWWDKIFGTDKQFKEYCAKQEGRKNKSHLNVRHRSM